ncbi:PepSY-like domain-containing protein [Jiulongibacter sp. NS-SX5]|uniref:PepSY-like domain-containing protein n=1 Tax=Jiulongibacter sp. NS-SX5 TaxID=3463854 RepID=UPI0040597C79
MKQLKFALIMLFGGAFAFTSCDSLSISPDASADTESAVMDLLFLASTDDSTGTVRGHKGKCNLTEVAVEDLSAAITDYIAANYADATIERAGSNEETGNTIVKITLVDGSHAGLIFDADGNFLEEKVRKGKGESIDTADLPAAITDYISANYADATIEKARLFSDGSYGVLLLQADETYLGVGFDAEGTFVSEFDLKDKRGKKHGKKRKN